MQKPSTVRKIENPRKRLEAATRLWREAKSAAAQVRARRDEAAVSLRLDHGWEPVDIYGPDLIDIARSMFWRIVNRIEKQEDRAKYRDDKTAKIAAAEATKALAKLYDLVDEAVALRDEAALVLMGGEYDGPPVSNADIARITGLSTARVAQIREGTR